MTVNLIEEMGLNEDDYQNTEFEIKELSDCAQTKLLEAEKYEYMYHKNLIMIHTICTKSRGPLVRVRIIHVNRNIIIIKNSFDV